MAPELQPGDFIHRSITTPARQLNCSHAPVFLLWDGQTLVGEAGKNKKGEKSLTGFMIRVQALGGLIL